MNLTNLQTTFLAQIKKVAKRKSLSPKQKEFLRELHAATKEFLDDWEGEDFDMDWKEWVEGISESYSLSQKKLEEVKCAVFDFFATPQEAIDALLDREAFEGRVWEPAAGDSRIVHALKKRDIDAFGTDIRTGTDFFKAEENADCIITNPPFYCATKFVERALQLANKKVAMLLPLEFLTGIERYKKIWSGTEFRLKAMYVFPQRIKFGTGGSPRNSHVWLVWDKTHKGDPAVVHIQSNSEIPTSQKVRNGKSSSRELGNENSQIPTSQENKDKSDAELLIEYNQQLSILKDRVRGVVSGFSTGAYFYGLPGISKTHTVLETLKGMNARFIHERGKLTPPALFELIENNHDKIIVLDDVSSIFEKADALQIFLAALDANRLGDGIVSYKINRQSRRVQFKGGIIALSNLSLEGKHNRVLQAIRDRIHPLRVNPTNEQIYALMREIATKGHDGLPSSDCKMVCAFLIGELKKLQVRPSMRIFIDKALKDFKQWKAGKSETHWQDLIRSTLAEEMVALSQPQTDISRAEQMDSDRRLVCEICFEFSSKKDRLAAWVERTGKRQSAFYRRKKEAEKLGLIA